MYFHIIDYVLTTLARPVVRVRRDGLYESCVMGGRSEGKLKSLFKHTLLISTEKAMAPHSSTLAWKIPWTEEPGRLKSMGSLKSGRTEQLHFHFSLSCTGEGNGNPLQYSCLENPRDGGAWWASVYGVAQRRTRLKRLSSSSTHIHLRCLHLYRI